MAKATPVSAPVKEVPKDPEFAPAAGTAVEEFKEKVAAIVQEGRPVTEHATDTMRGNLGHDNLYGKLKKADEVTYTVVIAGREVTRTAIRVEH
jgi:hypothetical protein